MQNWISFIVLSQTSHDFRFQFIQSLKFQLRRSVLRSYFSRNILFFVPPEVDKSTEEKSTRLLWVCHIEFVNPNLCREISQTALSSSPNWTKNFVGNKKSTSRYPRGNFVVDTSESNRKLNYLNRDVWCGVCFIHPRSLA